MSAVTPSGISITCVCGHTADFDDFTETRLGIPLPAAHFQCRQCSRAWKVETAPGKWYHDGALYIPGDKTTTAVNAVL